jgi:hypothetical protein
MILTESVLDLMCMYIVLIYSMLYAFSFAYPVIFGDLYNYNAGVIGLMFIPILIGAGFDLVANPFSRSTLSRSAISGVLPPRTD